MAGRGRLVLRVGDSNADLEDVLEAVASLRAELLDAGVGPVDPVSADPPPPDARGLALLTGWLTVRFGAADGLCAVVDAVTGWATRTDRVVEVSFGRDVLKVGGPASDQQERTARAWLARHSSGEVIARKAGYGRQLAVPPPTPAVIMQFSGDHARR